MFISSWHVALRGGCRSRGRFAGLTFQFTELFFHGLAGFCLVWFCFAMLSDSCHQQLYGKLVSSRGSLSELGKTKTAHL
jgi:hypothetical protein